MPGHGRYGAVEVTTRLPDRRDADERDAHRKGIQNRENKKIGYIREHSEADWEGCGVRRTKVNPPVATLVDEVLARLGLARKQMDQRSVRRFQKEGQVSVG